jgi:preprotein translocase SecF subunit
MQLALLITFIVFKIPINDAFIAVALTIIGYSINDTIVIYDRIRENKGLYKNIPCSELVNMSITQSMSRSINTGLATFISIGLVYIFAEIYGIQSIKNFALPMMIGVVSGCYSTIFIAGPLWVMWQNKKNKNVVYNKT